jgi:hypothetical protein
MRNEAAPGFSRPFACTISLHCIFPAFTIGLARFLMVLEALWLAISHGVYTNLYLNARDKLIGMLARANRFNVYSRLQGIV